MPTTVPELIDIETLAHLLGDSVRHVRRLGGRAPYPLPEDLGNAIGTLAFVVTVEIDPANPVVRRRRLEARVAVRRRLQQGVR